MKKNNYYLEDEIDLSEIIKTLWNEKILILSISIICGLLGYFYALLKTQEFKSEITLKDPPIEIFQPYDLFDLKKEIREQFISDFKLNLLSLDSLQSFLEESKEFDNFKGYLKSRNISAEVYFANKIAQEKEKNIIISNKYFLNHTKELDGAIFLNKHVEFIKKQTIDDLKNNLKLTLINTINNHQEALEITKLINLENPIFMSPNIQIIPTNEPWDLYYKGSKALTQEIIHLKRLLQKLENDQFNYNSILDKGSTRALQNASVYLFFILGLFLGFLLSLVIIFLRNVLKK